MRMLISCYTRERSISARSDWSALILRAGVRSVPKRGDVVSMSCETTHAHFGGGSREFRPRRWRVAWGHKLRRGYNTLDTATIRDKLYQFYRRLVYEFGDARPEGPRNLMLRCIGHRWLIGDVLSKSRTIKFLLYITRFMVWFMVWKTGLELFLLFVAHVLNRHVVWLVSLRELWP